MKLVKINVNLNNNTLLEKILELSYTRNLIYLLINFNNCNSSDIIVIKLKIYK